MNSFERMEHTLLDALARAAASFIAKAPVERLEAMKKKIDEELKRRKDAPS